MSTAWINEALKAQNIEKLVKALSDDNLIPGKMTPFEILLRGHPLREAQTLLGIPIDLAFIIDGIFLGLPSDFAGKWSVEVCSSISCAANLEKIGAKTMLCTVSQTEDILTRMAEHGGGPIDTVQCINALAIAKSIITRSLKASISRHDDELVKLKRFPRNLLPVEIAQAAAISVIARSDMTEKARLADWQEASGYCLDAIRRTAEFLGTEYVERLSRAPQNEPNELTDKARMQAAELHSKQTVFFDHAHHLHHLLTSAAASAESRMGAFAGFGKRRSEQLPAQQATQFDTGCSANAFGQSIPGVTS